MNRLLTLGAVSACALVACGGSDGDSAVLVVDTAQDVASPDTAIGDDAPDTAQIATEDANQQVLFTAPNGDYTVIFPGEPVRNDLPVPLPGETVIADAYLYEVSTAAYFTSSFDYPEGLTDSDPTVVLENARDGAVTNVGATLDSSTLIERSGIPGISFTFSITDAAQNGVGSAVVFFDAPRLYQSFALGETAGQADYQAFVETFEFTAAKSTETDS